MADLHRTIDRSIQISRSVTDLLQRRVRAATERYAEHARSALGRSLAGNSAPKTPFEFWRQWSDYALDATQRSVLFWDTLRQRGNQWLAHEAAGKPPVLLYKYELIEDARTYERPANYALVRIVPPQGCGGRRRQAAVRDRRPACRPRSGDRRLQGGFRSRRRAVRRGIPVYFVIFYPEPAPGQTLADITDAEAEFIRIVASAIRRARSRPSSATARAGGR